MSLEKALEANTVAVLALTEALSKLPKAGDVLFQTHQRPAQKKSEEKVSAPSEATPAPVAETPASTVAEPVAATGTSLTYDDIKRPFLELAKRDLAAAQVLIAEFGFKTLKDAKPGQYVEIKAKLDAMGEEGMA